MAADWLNHAGQEKYALVVFPLTPTPASLVAEPENRKAP
jgi:hypothetical protein